MANRSAIPALARGVRAYLAGINVTANVLVGWTARSRIDNAGPGGANRIVFVPGEFGPDGGPPRVQRAGMLDRSGPQSLPALSDPRTRTIAWRHEIVTCCVWAVDGSGPQDEELQIEATDTLVEQTIQAIHHAVDPVTQTAIGFGNVEIYGETYWTIPPGECGFGREYVFPITLLAPFLDQAVSIAYPQGAVARDPTT